MNRSDWVFIERLCQGWDIYHGPGRTVTVYREAGFLYRGTVTGESQPLPFTVRYGSVVGTVVRTDDGSVGRTDDGTVIRADDRIAIRTDDGTVVRTYDGSVIRTDDGTVACTTEPSSVRTTEPPSAS